MQPMTKTYEGVELTVTVKPHGKVELKMWIEFALNGTRYRNAEVFSNLATDSEKEAAMLKLEQWAQEIINDHKKKK